jgi:hypothetical protein
LQGISAKHPNEKKDLGAAPFVLQISGVMSDSIAVAIGARE